MTHCGVPLPELSALAAAILTRLGLDPADAQVAADVLCYADASGLGTHGVGALATIYGPRLADGRIDPGATPAVVARHGSCAAFDGNHGLGLVTMTRAVDQAAEAAREFGVGMATVRRSSHFGAAGYYAHRAAQQGLVGLVMTNCGIQGVVPPLGGAVRMLGTNPIGAGVPAGDLPPFVLDMSTTVVAAGKVAAARRSGTAVPAGWLAGPDGADVSDPEAYYDGRADVRWLGGDLERGGAKGYGLALLVELLCGPLAGAGFAPRREVLRAGPAGDDRDIGHLVIVIDPAALGDAAGFQRSAEEVLGAVRDCPPAAYASGVTYPGEPEARRAADAAAGVELPDHLVGQLIGLAARLGVALPAALTAAAVAEEELV
jgi:LDH2 family malate/lactate/ureidoglycolate dehydrogenase